VPAITDTPQPDAHDPEFYPPAWKQVGLGQTVHFSTAVIDQDLDETRVEVTGLPTSATFDAITQTITWTPTPRDKPVGTFTLAISQPTRDKSSAITFSIAVVDHPVPPPVAPPQRPVIETLLMIRQPGRLVDVNREWPIDRLLEVGAETFRLQLPPERRAKLQHHLDGQTAFAQLLAGLAKTHANPRLDPESSEFDREAFADPQSWKIVAFRPRIDKAWAELRVVYQATRAPEPVFAMFRLRPVVEYVPALPRPDEERTANNRLFLALVARHLMKDGGPNPAFDSDEAAESRAVAALMTELLSFDDTRTQPYLHGFEIGIALGARMGGGSARNSDGSYRSGDGWAWSAQKPFVTADGTAQAYVNVAIPGFWTAAAAASDGASWEPSCAPRFARAAAHAPGFDVLCRATMGLVDLPSVEGGRLVSGKIDANDLYLEHKRVWSVEQLALDDGRRDVGEENGMTCSQCHIRDFGVHDYSDAANVDPRRGTPTTRNHALPSLNFQIVPGADWQAFTLEFLAHQECRARDMLARYLGRDAAKGLGCPLAKE
jgi:hypothetical protein